MSDWRSHPMEVTDFLETGVQLVIPSQRQTMNNRRKILCGCDGVARGYCSPKDKVQCEREKISYRELSPALN